MRKKKRKSYPLLNIDIGGLEYKVSVVPKLPDSGKTHRRLGLIDYDTHEIKLSLEAANDEELSYVLFHEIVHATMDASTPRAKVSTDSEDFLHPFTRILWGGLKSSGLLNQWWAEKIGKR